MENFNELYENKKKFRKDLNEGWNLGDYLTKIEPISTEGVSEINIYSKSGGNWIGTIDLNKMTFETNLEALKKTNSLK